MKYMKCVECAKEIWCENYDGSCSVWLGKVWCGLQTECPECPFSLEVACVSLEEKKERVKGITLIARCNLDDFK